MRGRRVEVGHGQERVRRGLQPDQVRALRRRAGLVELDVLQSPAAELVHEHAGPEVPAGRQRDGVARLEQREEQRRRRGRPRGEEERLSIRRALEGGQLPLGLDP